LTEQKGLSIIIPSLDDSLISNLCETIHSTLKTDHEILIQHEKGYFNAVSVGVTNSIFDYIVLMDSDGSHQPNILEKMTSHIPEYDIVIGSRYVVGSKTEDILIRRLISRLFCKLARGFLGLNPTADVMSGYFAIKKSLWQSMNLNPYGYKVLLEILVKSKGKYSVKEVPLTFHQTKVGSTIKLKSLMQGLHTLAFMGKLFVERWTTKV
jgi:dolichol-phosphate mannosyltransferase